MKINGRAINRTVHSAWAEDKILHLYFTDGTALKVTWGNNGPELCGYRMLKALPAIPIHDGVVSRNLAGKAVEVVFVNDERDLVIRTRCGHEAVIVWEKGPIISSMNVRVPLPPVNCAGFMGSM